MEIKLDCEGSLHRELSVSYIVEAEAANFFPTAQAAHSVSQAVSPPYSKENNLRTHVYLMRVLWPQWGDRCSGGDSASDQSRGKGRQLATSDLKERNNNASCDFCTAVRDRSPITVQPSDFQRL
ncbi:hypothetical protein K0M31_007285 [Melipona bicolor]|uniref:Uncharacterized protein n=1 Tax=Melipona bicolor TaxID=60889 RepID=A0AA40KVN6_9HYME|nr:hypothetical protein K0M31_007285 [Melipona bicolor]